MALIRLHQAYTLFIFIKDIVKQAAFKSLRETISEQLSPEVRQVFCFYMSAMEFINSLNVLR
jgi:hypothetical protein